MVLTSRQPADVLPQPSTPMKFIQQLFDGPIDIVGDVHGEMPALESLLVRLGYDPAGRHPKGNRLVFVGDLVDRGIDSPSVVERVAEMVEAGRAQCVLGNHELNLVRGQAKEGNGWFQSADADHDAAGGHFNASARVSDSQRKSFITWFGSLPLALERRDLRVVHACWHPESVEILRHESRGTLEAYEALDAELNLKLEQDGAFRKRAQELRTWKTELSDPNAHIPLLEGIGKVDSLKQTGHPMKALTSGLERMTPAPFFATGKWRMAERVAWWNEYDEEQAVVFGHYWRWPLAEEDAAARSRGPNLFTGYGPFEWLGPRRNALCVDWCVGVRWLERQQMVSPHVGRVGALRWESKEIVLD